jgi:hypothetical protein
VGKPQGETELLPRSGCQIPEQLCDPVLEKIVQRPPFCSMVEVLRLNPFADETLGRYPSKKLRRQIKPLLDKPEPV